ncbi:hypothetical protein ACWDR0_22270 [Streptomyces sp. NPDC003691]
MRARAFGTAFVVGAGVYAALRRGGPAAPGGLGARFRRENRYGRAVTLFAGPAVAAGAAAGSGGITAVTVLAAAACGAFDDHAAAGDPRRGFRAHLGALRDGELTGGGVKLLGIGAAGLAAGCLLKERPADRVLAGVVIAGTAHLVNLVDTAPGRAVLTVLGVGAPGLLRGGTAGARTAAAMGAAASVAVADLTEETMLGDTGAHALGAALGTAIVAANGRAGLVLHAAGVVAAAVYGDRTGTAAAAGSPAASPV